MAGPKANGRQAVGGCLVIVAIGLAFFVLGGIFFSSGKKSSTTENNEEAPGAQETAALGISASSLFHAYHRNEVSADRSYKGRKLLVSGTVESIDKDLFDNVVVRLATSNEFESVDAHLAKTEEASAAELEKGQAVTILCTGGGMVVGNPVLNDCSLKK